MLRGRLTIKTTLVRFLLGNSIAFVNGPQTICATDWLKVCRNFAHAETLPKTEIKHGGLINLSRDISKQQTIGVVAWLLQVAFSQIYVENQDYRAK